MLPKRLVVVLLLVLCTHNAEAVIKLIATLIQDNVAGSPVVYKNQQWPFHPEEGAKKNPEFEALHGHRAYNLVERLGLGNDGQQDVRKYQQMLRDLGVPTTSYENQPPLGVY